MSSGNPRPRPGARPRDEKHIAILRQRELAVALELQQGAWVREGGRVGGAGGGRAGAHGWDSSDESDAGTDTVEGASPPGSLTHLKLSITETKRKETRGWADVRVTQKKYRYSQKERQRPDSIPANANKRLASRLYHPRVHFHIVLSLDNSVIDSLYGSSNFVALTLSMFQLYATYDYCITVRWIHHSSTTSRVLIDHGNTQPKSHLRYNHTTL